MKKVFAFLALSILLILPLSAHAATSSKGLTDWVIRDFKSDITVNQDSTADITEYITADCGNLPDKHGIFRTLPTFYQETSTKKVQTPIELKSITDFSDNPINYTTTNDKQNGTVTWKIGDTDKTVSDINYYKISYKIKNVIRFGNSNFDEFYWNLNGNFWQLYIYKYEAAIIFPTAISKDNAKEINLYSGDFGNKANNNAGYTWKNDNTLTVQNITPLAPGEGITISATFPKEIFTPYKPSLWELINEYLWFLIPILTLIICLYFWNKYGRDPKINSAVASEFEIPDNLSPIDMGIIYSNEKFKNQYLSASIINLAVKGYIKIEEIPAQGIFGHKDWNITKLKDDQQQISKSEYRLLQELFSCSQKVINTIPIPFLKKLIQDSQEPTNVDQVLISKLKNNFYTSIPLIQNESKSYLEENDYYDPASNKIQTKFFIASSVFLVITIISRNISIIMSAAFIATWLILLIFGALMNRRTEKGAMMEHRIKGFKMFMELTEKYHAQYLEQENIFEKLLPYAIMFGITKKWINAMEQIYGSSYFNAYHPVWFYGAALNTFDVNTFADTITSLSNSMANTMASSPSNSGAGGGGFSGGGGGGGGGGGW